jgi:DNA modification methylase
MEVTNALWLGDSTERLGEIPPASLHLGVTSPAFDDTFDYGTRWSDDDWMPLIPQLYRVLVPGGVICWQVRNQIKDGRETCSAERQVLAFERAGFWKHHTIYQRSGIHRPLGRRYYRTITPIYIFSKGGPRFVRLLRDRENKTAGLTSRAAFRLADGTPRPMPRYAYRVAELGIRSDLWDYSSGLGHTYAEPWLNVHPGIMHRYLARDLILTYSRPGEFVLDPYGGVATTAVAAILEGRRYLSIEREERFHRLAVRRVREAHLKRRAELLQELGLS